MCVDGMNEFHTARSRTHSFPGVEAENQKPSRMCDRAFLVWRLGGLATGWCLAAAQLVLRLSLQSLHFKFSSEADGFRLSVHEGPALGVCLPFERLVVLTSLATPQEPKFQHGLSL